MVGQSLASLPEVLSPVSAPMVTPNTQARAHLYPRAFTLTHTHIHLVLTEIPETLELPGGRKKEWLGLGH